MLRIGLRNNATATYLFFDGPPWRKANIVVTDAMGHANIGERGALSYKSPVPMAKVDPGKTYWLAFSGEQWSSLDYWSIKLSPGTYEIQAIPVAGGELYQGFPAQGPAPAAIGKFVTDAKTINSNAVWVEVTQ